MTKPDLNYGSDQSGLVWGFAFSPNMAARPVTTDEAAARLADADSGAPAFSWLHFSLANAATERWLQQQQDLPVTFLESLRDAAGSTRIEQDGDWLVAVIHDVVFDNVFDTADVSTVTLCVGPRALVSARPRGLRSVDRLRAAVKAGETFRSPAELLAHLLRDQANVLVDIVRRSTLQIDTVEDNLMRHRLSTTRSELGQLRRRIVRIQRLLAPEPAALFRLLNRPPAWLDEQDLQDLRQAAEEFSAAVADSVSLAERLKLIQEELSALVGEQNNKILYVLTLVTVLAVPFNVVAGLFGMNVGGIPWHDSAFGFPAVFMAVTVITVALGLYMLNQRMD